MDTGSFRPPHRSARAHQWSAPAHGGRSHPRPLFAGALGRLNHERGEIIRTGREARPVKALLEVCLPFTKRVGGVRPAHAPSDYRTYVLEPPGRLRCTDEPGGPVGPTAWISRCRKRRIDRLLASGPLSLPAMEMVASGSKSPRDQLLARNAGSHMCRRCMSHAPNRPIDTLVRQEPPGRTRRYRCPLDPYSAEIRA